MRTYARSRYVTIPGPLCCAVLCRARRITLYTRTAALDTVASQHPAGRQAGITRRHEENGGAGGGRSGSGVAWRRLGQGQVAAGAPGGGGRRAKLELNAMETGMRWWRAGRGGGGGAERETCRLMSRAAASRK